MLWYGSFLGKKNRYNIKKFNTSKVNRKVRLSNINKYVTTINNNYNFNWIIPTKFKFIYLKSSKSNSSWIYLWSDTYYTIIPISKNVNHFLFDINSRNINLNLTYLNSFEKLYSINLINFYKILFNPFFIKVKFKGKGYYIYKNYRNTLTPQFGYSHRLYLYTYFLHVNFLSKTNLIFFGLNFKDLKTTSNYFFNWRPLNIFTGRGVRFSSQIVYKKSGKISTYR